MPGIAGCVGSNAVERTLAVMRKQAYRGENIILFDGEKFYKGKLEDFEPFEADVCIAAQDGRRLKRGVIAGVLFDREGEYAIAKYYDKLELDRDYFGVYSIWTLGGEFASDRSALSLRATPFIPNKPFPGKPMELLDALKVAVMRRNFKNAVLFFSGGIDSTTLLYLTDLPVITVGTPESEDVKYAKCLFKEERIDWTLIEIDEEKVLNATPKVIQLIETYDPVYVSIAIPFFIACEFASERYQVVVSGIGPDEALCGYRSQRELWPNYEAMQAECWRRLHNVWKDLYRDGKIAAYHKLVVTVPYLDVDFVASAMEIPASEKYDGKTTKIPLRRIAAEVGVPDYIVKRRKRAFQYGSGVIKLLRKIYGSNLRARFREIFLEFYKEDLPLKYT